MKYRKLGRTGLEISEIGFGCGTSAGLMVSGPPDERRAAVERALERGITLFDTAPVYGDTLSEVHLAQALRELGAKPIISTKVALEVPDYDDLAGGVVRSLEGSLERLGVDVLPIVHMHNRVGPARMGKSPYGSGALLTLDDVLGKNGVVEGFERAKKRGLVRFIGCQAFGGDNALIEAVIDSGRFDSIIINYSMLNQSAWLDGRRSTRSSRTVASARARRSVVWASWHCAFSKVARSRPASTVTPTPVRWTATTTPRSSSRQRRCVFSVTKAIPRSCPPRFASDSRIRQSQPCWSGSPAPHTSMPQPNAAARGPLSADQLARIETLRAAALRALSRRV